MGYISAHGDHLRSAQTASYPARARVGFPRFDSETTATRIDDRKDYGEMRLITAGYLRGRMVVIVWTPRGRDRHIISMRHCHADEEEEWRKIIDQLAGG